MEYIIRDKETGEPIRSGFATLKDAEKWFEENGIDYDYYEIKESD